MDLIIVLTDLLSDGFSKLLDDFAELLLENGSLPLGLGAEELADDLVLLIDLPPEVEVVVFPGRDDGERHDVGFGKDVGRDALGSSPDVGAKAEARG